jgi:serine/threonine protein kinase/tetratricopeptide (TPR) repeat protein
MEPERWRLVEQLYHTALKQEKNERASFLEQASLGDLALREEVESLLACQEKAGDFIESPALEVAAQLLTKEEIEEHGPKPLAVGRLISHYRIIEQIGAGGMGEVYRAHDPRLGRDVAIKVLPQGIVADQDRLRRFEQEARAAAALNHPNIVAIYDVGTWEYGTPYVVSELLQGETLRERLRKGPLAVRKAIEFSSQIALGLAAAHDKGIVHRDLKPENLFLTNDGQIKILDFGLAKLLPEPAPVADGATATQVTTTTAKGTVGYMSPEQVRGQDLDQRTDIFSLGAVIYEMLCAQRAFQGATSADAISAILSRDPPELTAGNQAIPPVLSGIVRRSLEKNPNDRFQSARDLAFALGAVSEASGERTTSSPRKKSLKWRIALLALVPVLAAGVFWVWNSARFRNVFRAGDGSGTVQSLAVLPLENVSGNQDEYFADGMTDELITQLGRLKDVRVISRTSVMGFKATRKPSAEIGRALHVDALVEGSVLRQGERVRITAQLVDAASDRQLWAQSYEGNVSDVLRLQNEVARAVTDEIKIELNPEEKEDIETPQRATTPEAYDAYLHGIYLAARLTPDDLKKAFEYFNQSIAKDPTFAPAYAGLAEAYSWALGLSVLPAQDVLPKAESAADKALELDPRLGKAHHALAWAKYARHWDFVGAEREFQRAIELTPNNSTAHLWYGMFLAQRKRTNESLREMERARQLDPLAPIVNSLAMTPLLTSRQYDRVVEEANLALKTDPNDGIVLWILTSAYEQKGDLAKAIDTEEKQAIIFGQDPQRAHQEFSALRKEYSVHGDRGYWLARKKSQSANSLTDPVGSAIIAGRLGETDAMFADLEEAFRQHSVELLYWIQTEPAFDDVRGDPRFKDLLRRMGLPLT